MDAVNLEAETSMARSLFGGCVPIMIGAIGHRSLGDPAKIEQAARVKCKEFRKRYRHTPFVVLSPIAEGADRLLVRIAIEELGAKLFAVLPFPAEEYEKDFESSASKEEFRALLSKAAAVVNAYEGEGGALLNIEGEPRNEQYARAGGIIVEQSQILFAVWDGGPAKGTGGTAEQVAWFKRGSPPPKFSRIRNESSPLDPPEPGLLIHIDSRNGNITVLDCAETAFGGLPKTNANGEAKRLENAARTDIAKILKRTDWFNADTRKYKERIARNREKYPLGPADAISLSPDATATFYSADTMAISFARFVRGADVILYASAVAAVFFFNMLNNWPVASPAYFAIAIAIVVASVLLRMLAFDIRFLEYRALAEALRILFFWRIYGVKRQIWQCYLSKHSGVVRWMRQGIRSLEFCEAVQLQSEPSPTAAAVLEKYWLVSQINYYKKAGDRHWTHFKRWYWVERFALFLSLVLAAMFLLLAYTRWGSPFHWQEGKPHNLGLFTIETDKLTDVLQMFLGLLAAMGLAARSFLARRGDLELSKQFVSARQTFELALQSFQEACKETSPEWPPVDIIQRLGQEALLEQAEWLWLRHSRPFEMPG